MPHLPTFRKGWENEKLAAYLLSRFSFVAQPTSSADDILGDAPPDSMLAAEFKVLESLYHGIQKIYGDPMPGYVSAPYEAVRAKMAKYPV